MSQILRTISRASASLSATRVSGVRSYRATCSLRSPYKDSQDRESLQPRSEEHTKSGAGDEATAHEGVAFDPSKTRPESEQQQTQGAGDPLHASGANQELSKPTGDEKQANPGAGKETNKGGPSGGGSAPKKGGSPKVDG